MRAHSRWSRALALSLGWVMIAGVVTPTPANNQPAEKVTWPVASKSEVTAAGDFRQAGISPIKVSKADAIPLRVETFGQDTSAKVGVAGVVLKVSDKAGKSPGKTSI